MSLKSLSIRKVTRQDKLKLLQGKIASKMAKDANDPLYTKYAKLRKAYFGFKEKIQKKYGMRARKAAKDIANKSMRQ